MPAVHAVVSVPGSKSIANRALICAALAGGQSTLTNLPDGDDTTAMLAGLRSLGVTIDGAAPAVTVGGTPVLDPPPGATAFAGLAGTTSRFLVALAALSPIPITIDGHPPLRARPFGPLQDALRQLGVQVTTPIGHAGLPVTVQGPPTRAMVSLPGDVSSQFVSALMMIGPRLASGLRIELTTDLVSRPYVALTADVMAAFGVGGVTVDDRSIAVPAGSYRATELAVEPDASSASYPLAVAAVAGGSVTVDGLGTASRQGDARFADLLAAMGCTVAWSPSSVTVAHEPSTPLVGIDVDMAEISDLVPTVAVVAACATTPTRIRGVGFIRAKESDRLGDLAAELTKAGVRITETDDGLAIDPSRDALRPATLATHHDHRLAMAFGVLARVVPLEIEHPEVVSKSWPGFWETFEDLR